MKFQIENYENMTPEEKVAALEAYEPDMSGFVSKATFDKKASEAADLTKKLRERMTEEETKAAEEAKKYADLLARAEKAEHELAVNSYAKAYLAMGYDEKLANASAEAMAKGDIDTVFKNQRVHMENREKVLRTELLKETPSPAPGKTDVGKTKEEFSKMTLAEKAKFAQDNPDAYKEFYGGN